MSLLDLRSPRCVTARQKTCDMLAVLLEQVFTFSRSLTCALILHCASEAWQLPALPWRSRPPSAGVMVTLRMRLSCEVWRKDCSKPEQVGGWGERKKAYGSNTNGSGRREGGGSGRLGAG